MRWFLLLLVAACGASSPPAARPAAPDAPQLLGRPVALEPLQDPVEQTAYAYAQQALADKPPAGATMAQLTTWIDARTRTIILLDGATQKFPGDEATGLLAMILMAVTLDDLIEDIAALPVPADAKDDPSFTEASYREQLQKMTSPLLKKAALRYERCSQLMPDAPPALQVWSDHCRMRADQLAFTAVHMASQH